MTAVFREEGGKGGNRGPWSVGALSLSLSRPWRVAVRENKKPPGVSLSLVRFLLPQSRKMAVISRGFGAPSTRV